VDRYIQRSQNDPEGYYLRKNLNLSPGRSIIVQLIPLIGPDLLMHMGSRPSMQIPMIYEIYQK